MRVDDVNTMGEYDYFYCSHEIPRDFSCSCIEINGKRIEKPSYNVMVSITGIPAVMFRFPRGTVKPTDEINVVR